jgi:hypothetical protein
MTILSSSRRAVITRIVLAAACTALSMLAVGSSASLAASTVAPEGGTFEQTPLLYTTSDACGLLCTIATTRQAEGSNHFLHTTYNSLLGVIGTSAGTATITSPEFTWEQPTPSAISLAFSRRSSLGGLVGLNSGADLEATLIDETTSTASTIASEQLVSSEPSFHAYTISVSPSALVDGHSYRLVISEGFNALVGVVTAASIDLDNVGLDVTLAAKAASVGTATLSTPGEHTESASTTVDAYGEEATYALQYGTSVAYGSQTPVQVIPAGAEGSQQISSTLSGLQPGTTYHARFLVSDAAGITYGPDFAFTTAPLSPPSVGSALVGGLTDSGAIVSATVDPGANATSVKVDYGTSVSYGQSTGAQAIAAGHGPTVVQIPLSGLMANTTYHAQVVATNADGSSESLDLAFTTPSGATGEGAGAGAEPPSITATAVAEETAHSAIAQASINPHGQAASYEVQYGPTTAYGSNTSAASLGAETTSSPVTLAIFGLQPASTYHARFRVLTANGTSYGPDVTFTTLNSTSTTGSTGSSGNGGQSGTATGSSSTPSGATLVSDTSPAQCLVVQTKRRGLALRLLNVAGTVRISPSHPLRVTLARAARAARRISYSIGGGARINTSQRYVSVMPNQLHSGQRTVLRLLLTAPHHKAHSLRVTLTTTSCSALLRVVRSVRTLRVTVRRIGGSNRVTLALPPATRAPKYLTLITTSKSRVYRALNRGGRIRLTPKSGGVRIARNGRTLTVAGLPSSVTGLVLSFPMPPSAQGTVIARVTSVGGLTQSLSAPLR